MRAAPAGRYTAELKNSTTCCPDWTTAWSESALANAQYYERDTRVSLDSASTYPRPSLQRGRGS